MGNCKTQFDDPESPPQYECDISVRLVVNTISVNAINYHRLPRSSARVPDYSIRFSTEVYDRYTGKKWINEQVFCTNYAEEALCFLRQLLSDPSVKNRITSLRNKCEVGLYTEALGCLY